MVYTGYLRRRLPDAVSVTPELSFGDRPYILVTPGGGGDGEALIDWVLRAYEHDHAMPVAALLVLGPFMQQERQSEFLQRAAALDQVDALTFDAHFEPLMARAAGVVAMGGYNTFCEILSFDKPALLVPRTTPRREQYIRASRAQELGLLSMLEDDGVYDVDRMSTAIRQLLQQRPPSSVVVPGLLDGLDNVNRLVDYHLTQGAAGLRLSRA
jgi:predicted glycosyltransferase